MKTTYFLPPNGNQKVWMRRENNGVEGDRNVLNDDGVLNTEPTIQEIEEFKIRQDVLYKKIYPNFCL